MARVVKSEMRSVREWMASAVSLRGERSGLVMSFLWGRRRKCVSEEWFFVEEFAVYIRLRVEDVAAGAFGYGHA